MKNFLVAAEAAGESDVDLMNIAISLERAGIKAYQDAAATKLLTKPVLAVAIGFMNDHEAHLGALAAAVKHVGGTVSTDVTKLTYPTLATQTDILNFAMGVERQAAAAYLSVIPKFKDRQLAQVSASILGNETTHVAILAQSLGLGTEPYKGGFVT
jgi:rubrerythrin